MTLIRYELYNVDQQEVVSVVDISKEEADRRNDENAAKRTSFRYIKQEPLPQESCRCGAIAAYECVCEHM